MFKEQITRIVLNILVGTPLMILFNIEGDLFSITFWIFILLIDTAVENIYDKFKSSNIK